MKRFFKRLLGGDQPTREELERQAAEQLRQATAEAHSRQADRWAGPTAGPPQPSRHPESEPDSGPKLPAFGQTAETPPARPQSSQDPAPGEERRTLTGMGLQELAQSRWGSGAEVAAGPEELTAEQMRDRALQEFLERRDQMLREREAQQARQAAQASSRKATGKAQEALSQVKGVGPAKQQAVLQRFQSLEEIKAASVEDLAEVKGVGPALATEIKNAVGY
ncbi:MAG TPA: helix-hairpin-helix domain-containing protein [Egibacteraceae bacterium]|nr:helix-hairpin-helix domain-containing protein [Actinomycetota bacterium]HWB73042.1 helix-hairpin-helix domain-containing protein [Egibacteraceae bacterium]